MYYVLLGLTGALSGVLGGMGMGGGTLLIPLLTFVFAFNQKMVQGINLLSFSIMAIIIVVVHIKNKLIDIKTAIKVAILAAAAAALGAFLANIIETRYLKVLFGVLLVTIAIYQAIMELRTRFKNKDNCENKKMPKKVEKK